MHFHLLVSQSILYKGQHKDWELPNPRPQPVNTTVAAPKKQWSLPPILSPARPHLYMPIDAERAQLLIMKPNTFTAEYHNEEKFDLLFLKDFHSDHTANMCWSCQMKFPKNTIPPEDIVFAHSERYWLGDKYTPKARQLRLCHARYTCMTEKYPYFSTHYAVITPATAAKLTEVHEKHLFEQLGIEVAKCIP